MRRGVLSFGNIELDLERYQLRRSGRAVKIERQPMELLILLAGNQGRLILREEIVASLWGPNVFLDTDQSINSAIRKIRAALKDDPDRPRYVLTVVGKGYRFICPVQSFVPTAEVTPVMANPGAISAAPTPATSSGTAQSRWHYTRLAICLAALLVFPSAWLIYLKAHTAVPGIHSIAVLPLADFSANHDQEYFSAGITDAIITELARIDGLRVISHNSANAYQRTSKPLRQIANELNIDAVVEGGVVRSGTRVRITAQLIRARDERPLWADAYEGDLGNLLSLQNRVAGDIARKVNAKLAQPRLQNVRPVQPGAYEAYLRGRYFFDRRSADKSVGYFRQALSIDPQYAPAYAGLARALVSEASVGIACPVKVMAPAREAARHALGLEPELAEAYIALAQVDMTYDWNWTAAARDLTRARELSPNDPLAELNQAFYFSCLSRHDDALRHIRCALGLDPVSFFCNRMYASLLYMARRYDEALVQLQRTEELQEIPAITQNWISWIREHQRNYDEAVNSDLKSLAGSGESPVTLEAYRNAYSRGGWKGYWQARLDHLLPVADKQCVPFDLSLAYIRLGEREQAFRWLARAVDQHCVWVNWLRSDPKLDALRSDPRFPKLLARMHL